MVARRILTTEGDGTEAAGQADELLASVQAAGVADAAVVVDVQRVLEGEHGLQAVAQRFFTAEAEARAAQQAGLDAAELVGAAVGSARSQESRHSPWL
jgi:hypothetical protein